MKAIISPQDKVELKGAQRAAQVVRLLESTGASMRLARLRESIGPDYFDFVLTEKMHARLARAYRIWPDTWKDLVTIDKPDTMLDAYISKVAPFANLDRLADTGGVFQEVDTPPQVQVSYACSGWGNLIVADFETLRSDSLGWFKRISDEAGKAAARTFHKWLFVTMLKANPTIHDGNSLFDNTKHANDPFAATLKALTYDNLVTAWEKMRDQKDPNGEPILVSPAYVVCGEANEIHAMTILESEMNPDSANNERNYFRGKIRGVVVSPYLDTAWYLWASPDELEGLVVGFLDGNVDPAIYMLNPDVSDTYFRTKRTMWRVEHYFGGAWTDWRGVVRGSI